MNRWDMPTPEEAEDAKEAWDLYAEEEGYPSSEAMLKDWRRQRMTCHCCGADAEAACYACDKYACEQHSREITIPYPQHDSQIETGEIVCDWCSESIERGE